MNKACATVVLLISALDGSSARAQTRTNDLLDRGREVSMFRCSSCHQVTASQTPPKPVYDADHREYIPAPSFAAIARMDYATPRFLHEFITAPSQPMPEHKIRPQDVDAVVAYILSLNHPGDR